MPSPVVVLAGGTGGAKLARGMRDVVGSDLVVIANTGDDIEVHGGYVSPDPDLVTFSLAGRIDERGWGIAGDTFTAMDELRAAGEDVWFELGDEDLALSRHRAARLAAGERLTDITISIAADYEAGATVLPMCDEPVRTFIDGTPFQEWMIRQGGKFGDVQVGDVRIEGAGQARVTPEVREALATACAVIIGPSNPVISIGPILAVPGMREAMIESPGPVVAVSPFVDGAIVKGPTGLFMRAAGVPADVAGVVALYAGLIDGIVADERVDHAPVLVTDVLMRDRLGRRRLAQMALEFAIALSESPAME